MLTPFDYHLHKTLKTRPQSPIPSHMLAKQLNMHVRMARRYLRMLERAELVHRPHGAKSGWVFCAPPFEMHLLETLRRCERDIGGGVLSRVLAVRLGVPDRTVRFHLRRMELRGSVRRIGGQRSGYVCGLDHRAWRIVGLLREAPRPVHRLPQVVEITRLPERTARYYMARLERAGLARRPYGPRAGWVVL